MVWLKHRPKIGRRGQPPDDPDVVIWGGEVKQKLPKRILQALVVPSEEAAAIRAQLVRFTELAAQIADVPLREKLVALMEDTPANLLKGSLRRSLFEIEQCLTS